MADEFPMILSGDCENPEKVRLSHFEALVFLVDAARTQSQTMGAMQHSIEALSELPTQYREICHRLDELRTDGRELAEWRRSVDSQLLGTRKDLDALHEWKRAHDGRMERAQEQAELRSWNFRQLFTTPLIAWIVAGLCALVAIGAAVLGHSTANSFSSQGNQRQQQGRSNGP